jgi:hypothetical protein
MTTRPVLASVVEQSLADIFPDSVRPIQPKRIVLGDFHKPHASNATDA